MSSKNTIQKQIKELYEIDYLITKMEEEIELLRNINYRYMLMHGNKIQHGEQQVQSDASFTIFQNTVDTKDVQCVLVNHTKIGLKSNYQQIKESLKELGK
jgi:hypothetical protein